MTDSDKVWKGKIEIPNLSEEHDVEEVNVSFISLSPISFYILGMVLMIDIFFSPQVLVTVEKTSDESYQLKDMVRSVGAELIREKLSQYIKELRQGTCIKIGAVYSLSALHVAT